MDQQDKKLEYFDTILCTEKVQNALVKSLQDTGISLFGIKIFTVDPSIIKNMKTKDGKPVGAILVDSRTFTITPPLFNFEWDGIKEPEPENEEVTNGNCNDS